HPRTHVGRAGVPGQPHVAGGGLRRQGRPGGAAQPCGRADHRGPGRRRRRRSRRAGRRGLRPGRRHPQRLPRVTAATATAVDVTLGIVLVLFAVGLVAGWIDAVVGGGGLVQLPALLLVPGISAVQALATNKVGSIAGTTVSSVTYL